MLGEKEEGGRSRPGPQGAKTGIAEEVEARKPLKAEATPARQR